MVGLDDLRELFQPKLLHDSKSWCELIKLIYIWVELNKIKREHFRIAEKKVVFV